MPCLGPLRCTCLRGNVGTLRRHTRVQGAIPCREDDVGRSPIDPFRGRHAPKSNALRLHHCSPTNSGRKIHSRGNRESIKGPISVPMSPLKCGRVLSVSAAVVAGAAVLLLEANPNLTPNMVKMILMYTAQPLAGFNTFEQGAG